LKKIADIIIGEKIVNEDNQSCWILIGFFINYFLFNLCLVLESEL